jgi:hypothetical protein
MVFNSRLVLGAAAATLLFASPAFAHGAQGSSSGQGGSGEQGFSSSGQGSQYGQGQQSTSHIQGRITRVSPLANDLFVLDPSSQHVVVLKIDRNSQITQNGRPISLSDLKEGETIRAAYNLTCNDMHVLRLEVSPSGQAQGGQQQGTLGQQGGMGQQGSLDQSQQGAYGQGGFNQPSGQPGETYSPYGTSGQEGQGGMGQQPGGALGQQPCTNMGGQAGCAQQYQGTYPSQQPGTGGSGSLDQSQQGGSMSSDQTSSSNVDSGAGSSGSSDQSSSLNQSY